ncbi:MAG: hypothetical protein AAFP84_21640 [Actinomycetota bacterium]
MPANTRPKKFYAVRDFTHDGHKFTTGDEVPPGRTLTAVVRYDGDNQFVASRRPARSGTDTQPEEA